MKLIFKANVHQLKAMERVTGRLSPWMTGFACNSYKAGVQCPLISIVNVTMESSGNGSPVYEVTLRIKETVDLRGHYGSDHGISRDMIHDLLDLLELFPKKHGYMGLDKDERNPMSKKYYKVKRHWETPPERIKD
jgi:hypothetical protein